MRLIEGLRLGLRRLKRHPSGTPATSETAPSARPLLFFHPRDHAWFSTHIASRHRVALRVWSAVTSEFQTRFFTDNFRGRFLSSLVILLEDTFPRWCGRLDQYPIWKFSKPASLL